MIDWVRLWHDMPTDPKWRVIAKRSGRPIAEVIAVFNFVLVNASGNAMKRGETHNLFHDDIAAALDVESEAVTAIIKAMTGKVIDGKGCLTGWEKRQPKREDSKSTERVQEFRKRTETQRNALKRPDKDKDTDLLPTGVGGAEAPSPPVAVEQVNGTKPPSKLGTRLSDEWESLDEDWDKARADGLADDEIKYEDAQFKAYWISKSGKDATKLNWDMTWQKWMRKAANDKREKQRKEKTWNARFQHQRH